MDKDTLLASAEQGISQYLEAAKGDERMNGGDADSRAESSPTACAVRWTLLLVGVLAIYAVLITLAVVWLPEGAGSTVTSVLTALFLGAASLIALIFAQLKRHGNESSAKARQQPPDPKALGTGGGESS